ncbi:MAG: thiamine phosphate synthase [Gammaproteobacteria bacterium]|jgi:thiamine-phosphate pyrophosphorylase|nr:thiamine phosphate synthase [Gammaproteobacteria bacterium]
MSPEAPVSGGARRPSGPRLQRGLYAVTDGLDRPIEALIALVELAVLGGAVVVQYRDKSGDAARRAREAGALRELCRAHGVPLLVNDDVELARSVGADGVHLGRDDLPLADARARLGPAAVIGASCYADPARAIAAEAAGADYVAFGRFFPSRTKPLATPASVAMLAAVRPRLRVPVVAIGGITPENAPALIAAGADLLAVVQGVFGDPDPHAAATRFATLFETPS